MQLHAREDEAEVGTPYWRLRLRLFPRAMLELGVRA